MEIVTTEVTTTVCYFVSPLLKFMSCNHNFGTSAFSLERHHDCALPLWDAISPSNQQKFDVSQICTTFAADC